MITELKEVIEDLEEQLKKEKEGNYLPPITWKGTVRNSVPNPCLFFLNALALVEDIGGEFSSVANTFCHRLYRYFMFVFCIAFYVDHIP